MPRNRKYFPNRAVLLCTTRTEIGLPFVCSLIMNFILWGILARAREMYEVKVCHFVFLGNHFHMLLVVDNPEDLKNFIGYVKTESAHAVNRLLGRQQRTIWQDGYDSPLLLTVEDVKKYIRYIYLNPARAFLVSHIGDYPGVSSWEMFARGISKRVCKRLSRDSILALASPALSISEQKRLVELVTELPGSEHTFTLEPNAWMESFAGLEESPEEINEALLREITEQEASWAQERREANIPVKGATTLRRESMLKEHTPQKRSRRMICICYDRELRKAVINHFRELCAEALRVYECWRKGDLREKIPAGMFAPSLPIFSSALALHL